MATRDVDQPASLTSRAGAMGLRRVMEGMLSRLGAGLACGRLGITTPDGKTLNFAGAKEGPSAAVTLHRWRMLLRVLFGGDIGFAESYMAEEWSTADLASVIELAALNEREIAPPSGLNPIRLLNRLRHRNNRNTLRGSRRNIAAHYDLGNEFYTEWLDPSMSYSSALYTHADQSLEEAQAAKIHLAMDALTLKGGEKILEIGCGWGALAEAVIREHDCQVTGLTLSHEQLTYAQDRLQKAGVAGKADLRLQDYRDVSESFDRIVSIEMIEAVGEENWPIYFDTIAQRLVPGGVAAVQAITIDEARLDGYRRTPDFIQRYIFPGGMLPSITVMKQQVARAGLTIASVERFGLSYARTLAEWRRRFDVAWPRLAALGFTPRFRHMWEYYLAYCEAGFRLGTIDVGLYRIVKPG
jgi:cyclopropane-fatty-acyl-phospholipid synthase